MSSTELIRQIAGVQGWNEDTQLELLLQFLGYLPNEIHLQLETFLQDVANVENEFAELED